LCFRNQEPITILAKPSRRAPPARPSLASLRVLIFRRERFALGASATGSRTTATALCGDIVNTKPVLGHQRLDLLNDSSNFGCSHFRQLSFELFLLCQQLFVSGHPASPLGSNFSIVHYLERAANEFPISTAPPQRTLIISF